MRLRPSNFLLVSAVVIAATGLTAASNVADAESSSTYVVLYKATSVPADAGAAIAGAGGSVVASYGEIGVVIARSSSSSFRTVIMRDKRVEGAAATAPYATKLEDDGATSTDDAQGPPPGDLPNASASDADNLFALQWDMRQIHTPQAHAITGGSPEVVVGDIDTGLDYTHPDLAQNVDFSRSASCLSGAPDQSPASWQDVNGHGTHTAGTIAAASNGIGIVGVAPNVKIAGIKAGTDEGFFFPEAVICAFMWAGSQHLAVTNNSYFADPFLYNCRNDEVQRAIWKAEQRAILYAQQQGVTVVAAEGNQSDDLSHPTVDVISPDFPPGSEQERAVTNACVVIPVEIPGVVGVTANGNATQDGSAGQYPDHLKSFYSSYGVSTADVVAPGGDSVFGRTAEAPNGRVLSTYPFSAPCTRSVIDPSVGGARYCYLQGTSMASPHVAGVAALIVSMFGSNMSPQNGQMRPGQVAALLQQTTDPQTCPDSLPTGYSAFTQTSGEPQSCTGNGNGHTSWYGSGEVDAYNAVTHAAGG